MRSLRKTIRSAGPEKVHFCRPPKKGPAALPNSGPCHLVPLQSAYLIDDTRITARIGTLCKEINAIQDLELTAERHYGFVSFVTGCCFIFWSSHYQPLTALYRNGRIAGPGCIMPFAFLSRSSSARISRSLNSRPRHSICAGNDDFVSSTSPAAIRLIRLEFSAVSNRASSPGSNGT